MRSRGIRPLPLLTLVNFFNYLDRQVVYGMALAGHGRWRDALQHLRAGQELFDGDPAEQRRVDALVAVMRAKAPDSLRALFLADSVAAVARQAQRDSAMAHGKHKQP